MANDQKFDPAKTPGSFTAPPADAPAQVTLPGSERPTAGQIAQARRNEQELPVFAPKPMTAEQIRAFLGKDPAAVPLSPRDAAKPASIILTDAEASPVPKPIISSVKPVDQPIRSKLRRVLRPIVDQLTGGQQLTGTHLNGIPDHAAAERAQALADATGSALDQSIADAAAIDAGLLPPLEPATDADAAATAQGELPPPAIAPAQPWQPAASDTDTPSRGLPTAIADKNKQITGGFGLAMDAQYFPLDGAELREVIYALLGKIHDQLRDDLRFTLATTYPRVTARVVVEVSAYATDQSFQITRVAVDHKKTPLEVAREYADEVCFVVMASVDEMTPEGESVLPPDKMRKELRLARPHKQAIDMPGGGRSFVDIKS